MPKSLADGHLKFTILTSKPADLSAIPVATLNAGIDASCAVLSSDFTFSPADSDKVNEKSLCVTNNANAIGADNFQAAATFFRMFDADTGAVDETEDEAFQAVKEKGTTVWGVVREDGKASTDDWAATDEYTWMELLTDRPQRTPAGGYIKRRVPFEPQAGGDGTVAA